MVTAKRITLYVARCDCGTFSVYAATGTALDYAAANHIAQCAEHARGNGSLLRFEAAPVDV